MTVRCAALYKSIRRNRSRTAGARPASAGLIAVSQATRIANSFLGWYTGASIAWVVGSDALLRLIQRFGELPVWMDTAKGVGYVLVFGLALRRAARTYVEGIERAHAAQIDAKLDLVRRLALAAEYRDDETGGHNQRIGRFAAIVGGELGIDAVACETLSYAASLHDLGKIGVPDALLLKPGPFTPEERQAMERHTTLGAEILSGGHHPLVVMAHSVALTHHEWWDGTGYPIGLRSFEIPLEGRIVAVCDVFDALTSERPYKPAWSVENAISEIIRLRGTQFDPAVVDAFVRCLPEIELAHAQRTPCLSGEHQLDSSLHARVAA